MRLPLVVLAGASLAMASCGGSGDDAPSVTPITDPTGAVQAALRATYGLDSYHMEMEFSPIGEPLPATVEFDSGDYFERIPADLVGGGSEFVYVGAFTYRRDCTAADACGEWQRSAQRPVVPSLAGTTTSIPETLALTATEIATGWLLDTTAERPTLSGTVNLNGATQENQRRVFRAAGQSEADIEAKIEELWGGAPASDPSVIVATLTEDAGLLAHVTIYTPGQSDNPYFEVEFSRFNQVTVAAPEGFE